MRLSFSKLPPAAGPLILIAPVFFAVAAGAASWAELGSAPLASWREYKDPGAGISFSYPAGATVREETKDGVVVVKLAREGPSASAESFSDITFRIIPYGSADVILPDRAHFLPKYDAEKNSWMGGDMAEGDDTPRPICIEPVRVSTAIWVYEHTDAMHGWSSTVILGDDGHAYVWDGTPDSDFDAIRIIGRSSRTFKFLKKQKSIQAACPAPPDVSPTDEERPRRGSAPRAIPRRPPGRRL